MAGKSTFKIADVLERANTMLSNEHNKGNQALEILIETILMESENYKGFQELGKGHKFYCVADNLKSEYLKFQGLRDSQGVR